MTDIDDTDLRIKLLHAASEVITTAIFQMRHSQRYKTPQIEETGYYATQSLCYSGVVDKLDCTITVQFHRPIVIEERATSRMLTEEEL